MQSWAQKRQEATENCDQCKHKLKCLDAAQTYQMTVDIGMELDADRPSMVSAEFFKFCLGQDLLTAERIALFKDVSWEQFEWHNHHVLDVENFDACRHWPVHVIPLLKSWIDNNLTRVECGLEPPSLREKLTPSIENYINTTQDLSEEMNLVARAEVFAHATYQFEEPGSFSILEKFVPYSKLRFEYLGNIIPPRDAPFSGLDGVEFLTILGQAQKISTFVPGFAKATDDMSFEVNPSLLLSLIHI